MITYDPKDAATAWPEGDYPASLLKVENSESKKTGAPMEIWSIECWNPNGVKQTVTDYVVIPGALFKVKQLAKALGKEREFDAGTFQPEDQIGSSFTVALIIEQQEGYDDKNKIGRIKASTGNGHAAPTKPSIAVPDSKAAMLKAQSAFQKKHSTIPRDEMIEAWHQAVKKFFFGKDPGLVTAAEWQKFAGDGFIKTSERPFADDASEFAESDIPF